jgi:hypothetical protein
VNASSDGTTWAGDAQVPNTGIAFGPSAVEFNGQLYVFHQGSIGPPLPIPPDGDGCLWVNVSSDGATWTGDAQVPNTNLSDGPSAVEFNDKLYVFHNSQDGPWLSVNVSSDGATWAGDTPVPNTGITFSPSAVVFDGQLYVFHNGQDGQWLWANVSPDGTNWVGDTPVSSTGLSFSPGAVVWGGS